ncbi:MAG: Rossmann-like and DUF2520 domain-containing protein [Flavobacteriales bacterium]
MISIVIIGSGNVATQLAKTFNDVNEISLLQVIGRNKNSLKSLSKFTETTSSFSKIKEASIYIIAVSDDAITEVSEKLPFNNRLVVHTSGSVSIQQLSKKNHRGVFYPLQTFTKNKVIQFKNIPICIEAEHKKDQQTLETLGKSISEKVTFISSKERELIHLAAVFVNNFVNHLYHIGNNIVNQQNISFDLLKPLILETANKIINSEPMSVQTGPAKRNDTQTIEKQLHLLKNTHYKDIYKLLTQSIFNEFSTKNKSNE